MAASQAQWILGICTVVFDVDVGQKINNLVPSGILSKEEQMAVAFHAFPVSCLAPASTKLSALARPPRGPLLHITPPLVRCSRTQPSDHRPLSWSTPQQAGCTESTDQPAMLHLSPRCPHAGLDVHGAAQPQQRARQQLLFPHQAPGSRPGGGCCAARAPWLPVWVRPRACLPA